MTGVSPAAPAVSPKIPTRAVLLFVLLGAIPGALPAQVASDSAREAEASATVRAFHAALAAGDSTGAIALLHPQVLIFESGHAETLAEYRGGHLPSDIAFARATRRELIGETVSVRGDAALYTSEALTTGLWRGREIDSHGTETLVLIRTGEGWRIFHIHWSSR